MLLWLDHALPVKINKKLPFVGILQASDEQAVVLYRYPPKVPSKLTNSDLKTYKTVAVCPHFKIRSHFVGNPVFAAYDST